MKKIINVSKLNLRQSLLTVLSVYTPESISVTFRRRNIASEFDNERRRQDASAYIINTITVIRQLFTVIMGLFAYLYS